MSITTPSADFDQVLLELGQPIIIQRITRTVDTNGNVTATSISTTDTNAIVQEVSQKEKIWLQLGLVNLGDIMFFISPSTSLTIYDSIIWNSTTFKIRKVLVPPRINGAILFKQILTVQDSGSFPT